MAEDDLQEKPARARLGHNAEGALWMITSAFGFAAMASLVKHTGDEYSPALQAFYRQVAGLVVMTPLIIRLGRAAFHTTRPIMMTFRSAANTASLLLTFYAFQVMPLAAANAFAFTRALWLTPLAILVLGEKVGPLRIGAVIVGFAGVVLMLGPQFVTELHMNLAAFAMLGAAFLQAIVVLGIKVAAKDTSPTVLMVWSTVFGTLLLVPGAVLEWRWPGPLDLALLSATGVVALASQACFIKAMHVGDAAAMAPLDYFRLVFAALFGFVLFQEIPDGWTIAGAAVVVASTLLITLREQQLARRVRLRAAEAEAQSEL